MSRCSGRIFLVAIFLILTGSMTYAASGNKTMKLEDVALGKVVQVGNMKFVKVGTNTYLSVVSTCVEELSIGESKTFSYTGSPEDFLACVGSTYQLEVWGAQGGDGNCRAGYGGYAVGFISPKRNYYLYVVVGQAGASVGGTVDGSSFTAPATYNGGGKGIGTGKDHNSVPNRKGGSGGGATHIAIDNNLGVLANYSNQQEAVLIAAGGGAGNAECYGLGASGGGYLGVQPVVGRNPDCGAKPGTQIAGGSAGNPWNCNIYAGQGKFGRGGDTSGTDGGGGGGGWYGGGGASYSSGGGGSGYIAAVLLDNYQSLFKHMTCYECEQSEESSTYTISNTCTQEEPTPDCAKIGNGAARITRLN